MSVCLCVYLIKASLQIRCQKRFKCYQFLSISYLSNNEYWSQTRILIGNIHSIKLDVYAEKQSATIPSFIFENLGSIKIPETKLKHLIHILTANRLRHTSGPVQTSACYINTKIYYLLGENGSKNGIKIVIVKVLTYR